jgi:hypothetical protein
MIFINFVTILNFNISLAGFEIAVIFMLSSIVCNKQHSKATKVPCAYFNDLT